jgi:Fic family protein
MDGNGRMGRMWQTLLLYKENPIFGWLPVETLIAKHQMEYYNAIQESTKKSDSGIFTKFMLELLSDALDEFRTGKIGSVNDVANGSVNKVESQILTVLRSNPSATYKFIGNFIGKSERTIARAITALKDKGILTRLGSDKAGKWQVNIEKE